MEKNNKKKINIIFCINNLQKGGAEKQLNYISNFLCVIYQIHIFVIGNEKINYNFDKRIKIYKLNKYFFYFQFLSKIIKIKPKIAFFILPKSYFLFGTILIFFPKIKKILMRRSLNYYHKNIFYKYYEIFLHIFNYYFICNSYASKKDLIKNEYVPNKKIFVINNYIKIERKKFKSKKDKIFRIICISNFHRYKGHILLLETISYLKDFPIKLYLYGQNKDLSKKKLINFSKNLKISDKVFFVNNLNQNFSYPHFSLGVSFSATESFPNSILEYFSLGLPVLAYDTGDIKKLVNNSNGKLFKLRDPKKISVLIKQLYRDKFLNLKSKKSIIKLKKFTKKNTTLAKYRNVIDKILCAE